MRCASISVGIVAYEHESYRESSMRLLYAAEDAVAFHQYASTAWDGPGDEHRLLADEQASSAAVERAFSELVASGRFDILLVYLSGHGEVGRDGSGWFCLSDARPGEPSLGPRELDGLLGRVPVKRVILLLDCCYAEAVTRNMSLFGCLDGSLTRVFVASARSGQQSWEDDALKRSIFSDVLLRALSSDSDVAEAGMVDLEASLLPRLREQVPLNAAARKRGAVQEPISGGLSVAATRLPTVSSRSLGRELSVAETVRRRARRLLGGATLALVVGLLFVDGLAYHLAVAGTGEVLLRPGLRATYGLLPFHLGREADTGLALADLDPTNDALLASLGEGTVSGVSGHLDSRGLRPWLANLEGGLQRARQQSVAALAAGRLVPFSPDSDSPPLHEAAFLARLGGRPITDVAKELYPAATEVDFGCETPAERQLDFNLLSAESKVFLGDAAWLAATAPDQPIARAKVLSGLLLFAAYRSLHYTSEDDRITELRAFAAAAWRLGSAAPDREGFAREASRRLLPMKTGWCADHARLALALLSPKDGPGAAAEAELLAAFRKSYDDGREAEPRLDEQLAAAALAEIGRRGLLRAPTLGGIEALVRKDGLDLSRVTPAISLLSAVAPSQSLPASLASALLERMNTPPAEFDFSPLAAFTALAANARFLEPAVLAQVRLWAREKLPKEGTMSDFHRGLGYLAAATGGLEPGQREILEARLSPLSRFSPEALTYRGVTIITASDDEALTALGRAAQASDIPPETAERLANVAMGRPLLRDRNELVRGLAAAWYRASTEEGLAGAVAERLARARFSAVQRGLEVEVAAERLAGLACRARERLLAKLVARWHDEREPELRIALARVISLADVGPEGSVAKIGCKRVMG